MLRPITSAETGNAEREARYRAKPRGSCRHDTTRHVAAAVVVLVVAKNVALDRAVLHTVVRGAPTMPKEDGFDEEKTVSVLHRRISKVVHREFANNLKSNQIVIAMASYYLTCLRKLIFLKQVKSEAEPEH